MGKLSRLIAAPANSAASLEGLATLRRTLPTAEFDRATGTVRARAYAGAEPVWYSNAHRELVDARRNRAFDVGLETMEDTDVNGMYYRGVAAYPVGNPETRRHELFHGLVGEARLRRKMGSPIASSDLIDRLALADYPRGGFRDGAARMAEELAAWGVGMKRPLSWKEASAIAATYAPGYRREHGLMHALPAYAVGVSRPAAVAALAAGGGAGANALLSTVAEEELSPEDQEYLIQRLGE